MFPLLLALGGSGLLAHHIHKRKQAQHPLAPLLPQQTATPPGAIRRPPPQPVVNIPPGVPVPKGVLTPARAAVHGELMEKCVSPQKLSKAASLFGAEGLPFHADALLQKANILHNMMHGAKSIVERCRTGDQHAMALAKGIGDRARAGDKRAQMSAWLIEEYTKQNPAPGSQQHPAQAAA